MNNSYLQKGLNYFLQFLLIDINYEKKVWQERMKTIKRKGNVQPISIKSNFVIYKSFKIGDGKL